MKLLTSILSLGLLLSAAAASTDLTNNTELGGVLELLAVPEAPTTAYASSAACLTKEVWPNCLQRLSFQNAKSRDVYRTHAPRLEEEFKAKGLEWGAPTYIRVFKHPGVVTDPNSSLSATKQMARNWSEGRIEVWVRRPDKTYELFKKYPICALPGKPGPKWKEKDNTTPEGFYNLAPGQLNPESKYHLSFNIGYPNPYDVACHLSGEKEIGNEIMVHGNCVSAGCMAMTDPVIEEIYTIVDTSVNANVVEHADGKKETYTVPFHSFPFPMTDENLAALDPQDLTALGKYIASPLGDQLHLQSFWGNLKEGYEYFEKNKTVPEVTVEGKTTSTKYLFTGKKNKIVKRRCI